MTAAVRTAPVRTPLWYGLEEVPADLGPSVVTIGVFDGLHRGQDLDAAARALGRPHRVDGHRSGERVALGADTALPPPGRYVATVDGRAAVVEVTGAEGLRVVGAGPTGDGPAAVVFLDREEGHR